MCMEEVSCVHVYGGGGLCACVWREWVVYMCMEGVSCVHVYGGGTHVCVWRGGWDTPTMRNHMKLVRF